MSAPVAPAETVTVPAAQSELACRRVIALARVGVRHRGVRLQEAAMKRWMVAMGVPG